MIATGVASPRAQGQAMMRTVTKANRPCVKPSDGASAHHKANERRAMPMMVGTIVGCYSSLCIAAPLYTMWAVHKGEKSKK